MPGEEKEWLHSQAKKKLQKNLTQLSLETSIAIPYTSELYQLILETWCHHEKDYRIPIRDNIQIESNVNIKNTRKGVTGLNSEVSIIRLNDGRPFIVKKNKNQVNISSEAQFQHYAGVVGQAPLVYAYNDTAILMEKCDTWTGGAPHPTLVQRLLAPERLQQLQRTTELYDKTGMFIMDAHDENYVQRNSRVLQIDFDDVRFSSMGVYQEWRAQYYTTFGYHANYEPQLRILAPTPVDPPHYFWWRNCANVLKAPKKQAALEKQAAAMNRTQWQARKACQSTGQSTIARVHYIFQSMFWKCGTRLKISIYLETL